MLGALVVIGAPWLPVSAAAPGANGPAPSGATPSSSAPDDPLYSRQWNLTKVGAPAAWTRSTGQNILIGIVDTGVDAQQEDLAGKVVASTNCIGSSGQQGACAGSGQDDNGHGTHVAGIAAALTNNAKGVAGMAPGARLVVAKALDAQGNGSIDDVNAGIEWVVSHGARVVNLSLGSDVPTLSGLLGSNSLSPGIEYAWSHGAIPVLAAGNENFFGLGSSNYGNADAVIVGATGPSDEVAPYSSPMGNAKWALVAPGGDGQDASGNPVCSGSAAASCIVSTWWTATNATNAYAYDQGTSMATPMVSGTLALLLARGLTPTAAVDTLLANTDHAVSCGSGCAGRLDAAHALGASAAVGPLGTASAGSPGAVGSSPGTTVASPPTSLAAPIAPNPALTPGGLFPVSRAAPGTIGAPGRGDAASGTSPPTGAQASGANRAAESSLARSTTSETTTWGALGAVLLAAVAAAVVWSRRRDGPALTGR